MSLEDVIIHMRIQEKNKTRGKAERVKELSFMANVVEKKPRTKNKRPKRHNPRTNPNTSNKVQNPTFKKRGNCFVCGKRGHHAPQCRNKKRIEKVNLRANLAEAKLITSVVSSEVSMVTNMKDCLVVYSRATRHICDNISVVTSYRSVQR